MSLTASYLAPGGYPLERYWEMALRLHEKYGPVVKVVRYFGRKDMVMVYRPEDTKMLFQVRGRQNGGTDIVLYDSSLQ